MAEASPPRVALVIVAQAVYDHWEPLTQVPAAVRDLAEALTVGSYELHLPQLLEGGTRTEVVEALDQWLQGLSEHDRLLLYWTGHGTGDGIHYLVMRDSPRPATPAKAVPTRDLGDLIAQSKVEKILVILDTCFSSGGAEGIAQDIYQVLNGKTDLPGQVRFAGVLPSVHALQRAQEGVFCRALHRVLTDPTTPGRRWTDQDERIGVAELGAALFEVLRAELGNEWQPSRPFMLGWDDRFLPNPRYRGPRAAMDVETRRLQIPEALDLASRGVEVGEIGSYFTGRTRLLRELAGWLAAGAGLVVLTGPPGSGKSAVLGRLVSLSNGAARPEADETAFLAAVPEETVPPAGAIDAVVQVKGMTLAQCAREIADQTAIDLPPEVSFDSARFLDRVRKLGRSLTVVVDSLDESAEPREIGGLVRRLVAEAGARVIIGTRRSPDGRAMPEEEDRHGRLRALFGDDARILDLEDERDTSADIAAYVAARLREDPRSRHRSDVEGVARAAQAVAERAEGVFLYARVVSRTLQEAKVLDTDMLPAGPLEAFITDLETRFKDKRSLVDSLLSALAWGEGGGLSRAAWARVATALSTRDKPYDDADVAWVLDHAGFHILEAGEGGQTVYRLAHQSFADHYRRQVVDPVAAQRAITEALTNVPVQP